MADALLQNGTNLDPLCLDKAENESLYTESSLDGSSSSPKSVESDWSFTTFESKASSDGDDEDNLVFGQLNINGDLNDKKSSIVDGLLFEIYDQYHTRDSIDSDNITECSTTSGSFYGGSFDLEDRGEKWTRNALQTKDLDEIRGLAKEFKTRISMLSAKLVKQLKRRDRNAYKLQKNFDILTAVLQAVSLKRRVDTRIRFSYIPQNGKKSFRQWLDAFKAIARLPLGVPYQWRKRLWLCLAENKVQDLDWHKTVKFCFNERSNPDDDELGSQIVKDLHRTGCAWFCGQDTPEERAALKRVLLAYARWNKSIGYCQGFNVIAALILQVMERNEEDALKVMIYIVDHVLPTNYFSNNLRALSVDMAVLRDLMRLKLPRLSRHLESLQAQAAAHNGGALHGGASVYEPPLINVFTMQWFLTLFATCLPQEIVLRVWDSVLLDGSEVLLRVALAIWAKIGRRLEDIETSDEFYGKMGRIIQEIAVGDLVDCRSVMQTVYSLAPFPLPGLAELREQYTYNIHPFSDSQEKGRRSLGRASSDEEEDDADLDNVGCLGVLLPFSEFSPSLPVRGGQEGETSGRRASDIAEASPGVFATDSYSPSPYNNKPSTRGGEPSHHVNKEMNYLQKQYSRMRQMQQQAVVVFSETTVKNIQEADTSKNAPTAINHLFVSASKKKLALRAGRGTDNESTEKDDEVKAKQNAYERESIAHLNALFKGNEKNDNENDRFEVKLKARSASVPAAGARPKLEHVNFNGDICKLEASRHKSHGHQSVSLHPSGEPPRIATVGSLQEPSLKGSSSAVEILDKNSPSILNSKGNAVRVSRTKSAVASSSSAAKNPDAIMPKSWLMQEDKRSKYPADFKPFPQRNKATGRNRILYGNMSDKGVKRMEAFQGRRELRSPNGHCLTEESKS